MRDQIQSALKDAMKAGDKPKLSALRLIHAAIKDRDIQNRTAGPDAGINDQQILETMAKMIKQRQESLTLFEQAGRDDLALRERGEIEIIQSFMPQALSDEEMTAAITKAIAATGAASVKDMGKVMGELRAGFAGRMDFSRAGPIVKGLLS
ncbi:MAG: GatB/YqeY domain-containing protein [Pseudomonadota bacterium]|nr:GatB/YqeY domain-containing protein [Pseudomonadota bacterium]